MKKILKLHDRSLLPYVNKLLRENYKLQEDIDKTEYYCSESDLSWVNKIFINAPSGNELKNIITKHYSHIELYHTCRPRRLKPYYEHGIQPLKTRRIEENFKELVQTKISGYRDKDINIAINKARNFYRNNRQQSSGNDICFHFDRRHALEESGFCFYCGEYMCDIIRHYPDKKIENLLIKLCRNTGIPTLFTVRLALDQMIINAESFMSYIRTLLVYWASRYIYKEHLSNNVNYICSTTYNLHYTIAPEFIYRHEHPRQFFKNINQFYCDKCKKIIR